MNGQLKTILTSQGGSLYLSFLEFIGLLIQKESVRQSIQEMLKDSQSVHSKSDSCLKMTIKNEKNWQKDCMNDSIASLLPITHIP